MRIATSVLVSVYTQVDTNNFQAERDFKTERSVDQRTAVPSAIQIAVASSLAFLFLAQSAYACSWVYKRSSFEVFHCLGCSNFVDGDVGNRWSSTWKSTHYEVLC
ncbi:hypothetical protein AB3S75_005512 [Citrus x aurantiifolia]